MKRRTMIGLAAVLTGGLVAVGAGAWAFGPHGRHAVMKRFVAAEIDEALDRAGVTADQRTAVHAARDRVFATFEEHGRTRGARMEAMLAAFESDQVDPARMEALRRQAEEDHRKIGDAIAQALLEVHDVLRPEQRHALADYVRGQRWGRMH